MQYYMSEGEQQYQDANHGHFSRSLAKWAIGNMETMDESTKKMKALSPTPIEEVEEELSKYNVHIEDESVYDAWYLWNMARADYPKSLKTKEQIAFFVEETLCDPDCDPTAVLACFRAKMDVMNMPIYWERYI